MRRTRISILLFIIGFGAGAQNVGIGADAFTPDPSAGLEIQYSDKGMLIPRVALSSESDGSTISSPATSLLVYNTGAGGLSPAGFYYNAGTPAAPEWVLFTTTENLNETAWKLDGNSGTVFGTNFLGTTDNQDMDVRTNDTIHFRFSTKGQLEVLNTGNSIFIGDGAGENDNNVFGRNIFIGDSAGSKNLRQENTAIGCFAMQNNMWGVGNTAIGSNALNSLVNGNQNIAIGTASLRYNTYGSFNIGIGVGAIAHNDTGQFNVVIGNISLSQNENGSHNIVLGSRSMNSNTNGNGNIVIGDSSLYESTTASKNIVIGHSAMREMSYSNSGNNFDTYNIAIGDSALYWNNPTNISNGLKNTAVGHSAMQSNTTGYYNNAFGYQALYSNTTGFANVGIGTEVLVSNTTGYYNVAMGYNVMKENISGAYNVADGYQSLTKLSSGGNNVAIGAYCLNDITTTSNNVALGSSAGSNLFQTTQNSLYLGYDAEASTPALAFNYSVAIGQLSRVSASQQVRIGNGTSNPATSIGGPVAWTTTSDGRFKDNVQENVAGLDFVMKLRPVTYNFDNEKLNDYINTPDSCRDRESSAKDFQIVRTGFIAQEVEAAAKECGFEFSGVDAPKNEYDYYGLRYAEFVVPLVKATQEQQLIIEEQEKQIESQQKIIDDLLKRVEALESGK